MALTRKSNQQTAAVANRRLVLSLLRQHQSLSRRQLSQLSGLRDSTLTYIVRELMARKLVRTAGLRESREVGKKQILLEFDPRLGFAIGVELRRTEMALSLMDAAGTPLDRALADMPDDINDLGKTLRVAIDQWLDRRGVPPGELLGIGIGVPGAVDVTRGVILKSTQLRAHDVALAEPLQQVLSAPVLVDHNANFAALAEARAGAALQLSDFIQFTVNHERRGDVVAFPSIGAALILRGELYRGVHFGAGELDPGLAPPDRFHGCEHDLATLADPDAPITDVLDQLACALGVTLAHIVNFLDPQAVIVGGMQPMTNRAFLDAARESMQQRLIPLPGRNVQLLPSSLGAHAVAHGGAWAALESARYTKAAKNGGGHAYED